MGQEDGKVVREEDLAGRIFTASASMVGICLTAIGLLRISNRLRILNSLADEILAVDAVGFLISSLLAYLALKAKRLHRRARIERIADGIFLLGLCVMVVVCGLVAYELM